MILLFKIIVTAIIIWLGVAIYLSMAILKEHHDHPHAYYKFSVKDEIQIAFAWPALVLLFIVARSMDLYDALRKRCTRIP